MALRSIEPRSPEWHAIRLQNIGASEVAALFDVQPPYALSAYPLHMVKAGLVDPPPVDGERIRMGVAMEPVIGRLAAERHGWTITPGRYATDDTTPGMAASLDFEVAAPADLPPGFQDVTGPGCLETKNVDGLVYRKSWTDGEPPVHQLLQLQHQLACTGYEWGCLAALIGGNELRTVFYRPRPRIIASIRERVTAFWQAVRDDRPPNPDGSSGANHALRALFPDLAFDPADLRDDNQLPDLCAQYIQATADTREADARKDELRNQIMAKVGAHRHAMVTGFDVTISVVEAKPARPAPPGFVINGRAEARRLLIKPRAQA